MKVIFLQSGINQPYLPDGTLHREEELARALATGLPANGDEFEAILPPKKPQDLDCDFVAVVGMKRRDWMKWCTENGRRYIYLDKGYYHRHVPHLVRKEIHLWRISIDKHQPTDYIARAHHTSERWNILGRQLSSWRKPKKDSHIIIANSSRKYHEMFNLPNPTRWVENVVEELRKYTKRPIWYRPKPSWREATPIEGTRYCRREPLYELFPGCHALITHGSYVCMDALLSGVPGIILGDGVTRPISSTSLSEIEEPRLAFEDERMQILNNLAWCQYCIEEWASGTAWYNVKRLFL